jgi:Holliday junction resolvase RusA-like endonuclease
MTRWTEQQYQEFLRRRGVGTAQAEGRTLAGCAPSAPRLVLTLPCPVGVNQMYANVAGKGRVLTEEARRWKQSATMAVTLEARKQAWYYTEGQRLYLHVTWHMSAQRDVDGGIKPLQDALAAALGFNDRCVDELIARRGDVTAQPTCDVVLGFMDGGA